MKRPHKQADGLYHIKGHTYEKVNGSRRQVWHGTAFKTEGGLEKSALILNKHNRIVSRKKHFSEKKMKRLQKHGFFTRKGQFGSFKKEKKEKK